MKSILLILLSFSTSVFAVHLTFQDFKTINPVDFEELIRKTEKITTIRFPDSLVLKQIPSDPRIGLAIYFEMIKLTENKYVEPVFTHELAHIIVYYNLFLDIKEVQERHFATKKLESLEIYSKEWTELRTELGSHFDPRLFSFFFEEVFGDLLAAHIFNDPGVIDNLEPIKGYRNFDMDMNGSLPASFWDPHYALQPLGKYIYLMYLKPNKVKPSVVFDSFYELIKNETESYVTAIANEVKHPLITPPLILKREGKFLFNGKDLNTYIKELKSKFDILIDKRI